MDKLMKKGIKSGHNLSKDKLIDILSEFICSRKSIKRRRRDLSKMEILAALLRIGISLSLEKLARKRNDFRHTCHRYLQNQDGAILKIEFLEYLKQLIEICRLPKLLRINI